MKNRIGYDACFSVNDYRGMGVYMNAMKTVLAQYENIEVEGLCNCPTNDEGVRQIGLRPYPLWEQISLPAYLKKNKKEVFIFPYNTMPFFLPRGIKKILVLHDVIFLENIPGAKHSAKQLASRMYRKMVVYNAYKKAEVVITVSEYSKKRMQQLLGPRDKIYVIPSLVKNELKETVNKTFDDQYFLNIGGDAPSKNIFALVQAYCSLPKDIIGAYTLKLVGKYGERFINQVSNFLQQRSVAADRVQFTGRIDNDTLVNLYRNCRMVIFPSLFEGFGLPSIEAMAFEKPLVASNASSIPEVAGAGALYFDPESIPDMKNKIQFALSDQFQFEDYRKHYKGQLDKYSYDSFVKRVKTFIERDILTSGHQ